MKFLDNLFKKPDKDRKAAYKPSSPETKAVQNKGGGSKGSRKDMDFGEGGPSKEQRKRILASQNDNRFGYYDMNTGKYVPAFIDMFDGGGKNTSGEFFEGAGLYSAALNAAGVAPYGFNRPRTYAQAGMENRPALPAAQPTPEAPKNYSNMSSGMNPSNAYVPDYTRPEVEVRSLPSQAGNPNPLTAYVPPPPQIGGYDTVPESLPNAGFYQVTDPIGLLSLQGQNMSTTDDPAVMIAMLREEMRRRENAQPTLMG